MLDTDEMKAEDVPGCEETVNVMLMAVAVNSMIVLDDVDTADIEKLKTEDVAGCDERVSVVFRRVAVSVLMPVGPTSDEEFEL